MNGAQKTLLEMHNLTGEEYEQIMRKLGREPNLTELGLFSVMWSEHCSYKSSRMHLKRLPTKGPRVLQGPGENAGVVDLGHGLAAVFKIESHNHPSFIEPFQGAATGVGGIIRDIFTMGARPVALMNSLRFGPLSVPKNRSLLEGVVAGIASYGNSTGIPTVGGEVAFEECYSLNPLVNAFCLGIAPRERIFLARAEGEGNPVIYVGAKTGKDGIHGATMASAEFDEAAEEKRPTVQVGDPFMEKLLFEACLELMATDALVAIQDMGAAGLTCSTSELAARGGTGIEIDIGKVPQREKGMTPYEIMLSESQERMLLVAKKGREAEVEAIFEKWDLHAVTIGRVTGDGMLRVRDHGTGVAAVPCQALVEEGPIYERPLEKPAYLEKTARLDLNAFPEPKDPADALRRLVCSHGLTNKHWVFQQYDHMVQSNTIVLPGSDAGVIRLKGTPLALAMSLDGNGRYTYLDPYLGGALAVAESCRNLAAAGATPVGATNCLNFGSPEKPEVMWQFARVIDGMADACRALEIPITGGNVSFYNETEGESIFPTPVVGAVGILEDKMQRVTHHFKGGGDWIYLAGETTDELGGSEYLKTILGAILGLPPALDLEREKALHAFTREAAAREWLRSAHDLSEGGLGVAIAESLFGQMGEIVGATISMECPGRADTLLFSEGQSRMLLSISPERAEDLESLADGVGVPLSRLGVTGGEKLRVQLNGVEAISFDLSALKNAWWSALEKDIHP